jgi:hypothetical protein
MNKTLIIYEDEDGFLGPDSKAIEQIDISASKEAYEELLSKKIFEFYPDVEVEFSWGSCGQTNFFEFDNPDDLQADLEWMEDLIYNGSEFWVLKNGIVEE